MERAEIKNRAKQVSAMNRRLFVQILILYFCVLLFSILITYIVSFNRQLLLLSPEWLIGLTPTPYALTAMKILSTLLSAPVFILINKAVYNLLDDKKGKLEFHNVAHWLKNKDFLIKSLALGVIMCVFTVPFDVLSNITKPHSGICTILFPWPWSVFMPILFSVISIAFAILLDFIYCIASLYPEKSAIWVTVTSVKVIAKNLFDYIVFVLSFILWFLIGAAGTVLLAIFAKNMEGTYLLSVLTLLFVSPLMMGIGFYFWPYYNIAKAIFCKELINKMSVKA